MQDIGEVAVSEMLEAIRSGITFKFSYDFETNTYIIDARKIIDGQMYAARMVEPQYALAQLKAPRHYIASRLHDMIAKIAYDISQATK